MIIEIERKQMSLYLSLPNGQLKRQVFAEMANDEALRLLREYGLDSRQVYRIDHETISYRHAVDDNLVREVLERTHYTERRDPQELLDAVRSIVPQATRIFRTTLITD